MPTLCPYYVYMAGSGKTFLLEGTRAKDVTRMGSDGDGLVHLAADELFKQLHQRAATIGARGGWAGGSNSCNSPWLFILGGSSSCFFSWLNLHHLLCCSRLDRGGGIDTWLKQGFFFAQPCRVLCCGGLAEAALRCTQGHGGASFASAWYAVCALRCAGDQIAQRRRMPTAKAFESFVESTCVEV